MNSSLLIKRILTQNSALAFGKAITPTYFLKYGRACWQDIETLSIAVKYIVR